MRELLECHGIEKSFAAGDIEWEGRVVAAHHKLASMERRMAAGELSDPARPGASTTGRSTTR